ncbi:glycine betaine/proline transport system substrate-binding protein [Aminobacter aminovorans]|uniref:Glycine betaine-binding periplasmic protein n=1 Tax=Aminobacter aminovorans TaxID=83263 RepID=A0A380WMY2_AMIAI|nr:glycine betaine ABC transporter substrate-binding protein [Aminobacter aminovorans]TCS26211.1 glycine betaine/proline transport system substrate-binding protein [Aminobacter aminovorans]SUU90125.1 Glycine betaine-binding periplasmic protein precursor [Aminobacter aminovorans]
MKALLRGVCVAAVLLGGSLQAHSADLVVAMPNWPSGQASANIIKVALEKSLKIEVEVEEMGTLIAFTGLDSGKVDIHPEVWRPNLDSLVQKYVTERGTVHLSPRGVSATQGLCVTQKTYDDYGIHEVADLTDPLKTKVFDTDGDGKGEIWIGAQGWSSTDIERIRAKSYGYAATMTLLEMPEEVGMSAVDAAVATDKPIVFYCYSPHHVFELHQIKQLSEPSFDSAKWNVILPADDPMWLSKSDAPVAWKPSSFSVAYATSLSKRLPQVARFLDNIDFSADEVTAMGYALEVERQDPAKFAEQWVASHEDRVKAWMK